MGGVVGLSAAGLSVLPLSSVIPGPLPAPDTLGSEPEATASRFVEAELVPAGDDVDWPSLVLKRFLWPEVLSGEGADFRLRTEGGEYEKACGSTAV